MKKLIAAFLITIAAGTASVAHAAEKVTVFAAASMKDVIEEAAKQIKGLIGDSVGKVDEGGQLIDQAGQTMARIVNSVQDVAQLMSDIHRASTEQSTGIEEVNHAVSHMDEMTQQNAALVEEAAAAAASMQEQTQSLERSVHVFKLAV